MGLSDENATKRQRKLTKAAEHIQNVQIPGIVETFQAVNVVEKIFWAVFLAVCIALTVYNVFRVSHEYLSAKPTISKVSFVQNEQSQLPDMELCMPYDSITFAANNGETRCDLPGRWQTQIFEYFPTTFNSTEQFRKEIKTNFVVRYLTLKWLEAYDSIECYAKKEKYRQILDFELKAERERQEALKGENIGPSTDYTAYPSAQLFIQPGTSVKDVDNKTIRNSINNYTMIDEHMRQSGVTVELAFELIWKEFAYIFAPLYVFRLGRSVQFFRNSSAFKAVRFMTTSTGAKTICVRLFLSNALSTPQVEFSRLELTVFEPQLTKAAKECQTRLHILLLKAPFLRPQPYANNLQTNADIRLTGVHGKTKSVQLRIRSEVVRLESEGCHMNAVDQNLCRLRCRYDYIKRRCQCAPKMAQMGTLVQQESESAKTATLLHYDNETSMRECNLSDYYQKQCYQYTDNEEDRCFSDCLPSCTETEWMFENEQLESHLIDLSDSDTNYDNPAQLDVILYRSFSYLQSQSELKLTWFNVLSDVGGALGLCLGLSMFTLVHTLVLPIHECLKRRAKKRNKSGDNDGNTELQG